MNSAAYVSSPGERRRFAALRRRLTPDATRHRAYLREAGAYVTESRSVTPCLAHDSRVGRVIALEVWHSALVGRRYLVACVEPSWYHAAAPGSDAMTSTLSGGNALPPLVIVPYRRQHPRSERFRAIVEHEFVHINQAILGTLLPSPCGTARQRLASLFFTRWRNEYEAHALQATRWPSFFPHGFGLSLEHWCVLRGYTDALETVFVAAWRGECRPRDLTGFLTRLSGQLRRWLRRLDVDETLVSWFRRHLVLHVAVALLNLARTRPGFGASASFRTGLAWVGSAARVRSARRARAGGPSIQNVAIVPDGDMHALRVRQRAKTPTRRGGGHAR